ncbi:hypothetical protein EC973_001339 [Apophysomyces ossiformis]|uniref:Velvet domain-containing protein n=1 Tax=Apophysomyces ossiformis TaxID=679940 RepID=A0A8H7BWP8_9FUNG|nr:hypothetical protein EC973_001339 [Apophysomyces ossiformis]
MATISKQDNTTCTYRFISSSLVDLPEERGYELVIRQQPQRAKVSVINERDRRPIEPPPILQMHWLNCSAEDTKYVSKTGTKKKAFVVQSTQKTYSDDRKYLQSPFYFMVANLVPASDPTKLLLPSQDYLSGSTVSSLYRLRDIDNTDGGFFVFGDLAVKKEGKYQLQFSLFEIVEGVVQNRTTMLSDVFTVFVPKRFPGPLEATFLSRTFSDQGVKMRIRKEHRLQSSTTRKRKIDMNTDMSSSSTETTLHSSHGGRSSRRKSSPEDHSGTWQQEDTHTRKPSQQQFTFTNKFRYHYEPRDHPEYRQLSPSSSLSSDGERTMRSQSFGGPSATTHHVTNGWQPSFSMRPAPPPPAAAASSSTTPTRLFDPMSNPPSPTLTFTSQYTSSPPSCSASYDLHQSEATHSLPLPPPSGSTSAPSLEGHDHWRLPPLRAIMADVIPCRRSPLLLPAPIPMMHEQPQPWVPHGDVQPPSQRSNVSGMLGMSHLFAAR